MCLVRGQLVRTPSIGGAENAACFADPHWKRVSWVSYLGGHCMSTSADSQSGQCECDQNTFKISGEPLFRSICHCEICQEFNNAPFADITVYRRKDVDLPEGHSVAFTVSDHLWEVVTRGGRPLFPVLPSPAISTRALIKLTGSRGWVIKRGGGKGSHVKLIRDGHKPIILTANQPRLSPAVLRSA
jgi:hypothetical protein